MINNEVKIMIDLSINLKNAIKQDIIDVQEAKHEELLKRNNDKLEYMNEISIKHSNLNDLLATAIQNDEDMDQYRDIVNELEEHLHELYALNGKLASIVLPVKQMYKDIIDEISLNNGGSLIEVKA